MKYDCGSNAWRNVWPRLFERRTLGARSLTRCVAAWPRACRRRRRAAAWRP